VSRSEVERTRGDGGVFVFCCCLFSALPSIVVACFFRGWFVGLDGKSPRLEKMMNGSVHGRYRSHALSRPNFDAQTMYDCSGRVLVQSAKMICRRATHSKQTPHPPSILSFFFPSFPLQLWLFKKENESERWGTGQASLLYEHLRRMDE